MRLTLRTLLAYRDGVLSPSVTSDLHQRIQQTEVASNLLRRIETLVQQKEMLAPKAIGTGLGGDANSVAEYLDDTLASEQVAEFERICIAESDLVLAELAHCHHLLAEALNSKVHVPASLKALAVGLVAPANQAALAARLKPPRIVSAREHAVLPAAKLEGEVRRLDHAHDAKLVEAVEVIPVEAGQIVEVKSEPRAVVDNSVASVAGEAVVASGGLVVTSRAQVTDTKSQVAPTQVAPTLVTAPVESMNGASEKARFEKAIAPAPHQVPDYLVGQNSGGWKMPAAIAALMALLAVLVWQALGPLNNVQNLFGTNTLASSASRNTEDRQSADATVGIEADVQPNLAAAEVSRPVDKDVAAAAAGNAAASTVDGAKPSAQNDIKLIPAQPAVVPKPLGSEANSLEGSDSDGTEKEQAFAPEDGTSLSPSSGPESVRNSLRWVTANRADEESVLLLHAKGAGGTAELSRMEPGAIAPAGVELVVPPLMRPTLEVAGICSWTVCGPTRMQLSKDDAQKQKVISTSLCRAIAKAVGDSSVISLATPAGDFELNFGDAKSMASIEVAHRRVALGELTNKVVFKPLAIVVAVEGQLTVTLKEDSGESKRLKLVVGEGAALIDGQLVEFELGTIPTWYRTSVERPLDGLAAADLHLLLSDKDAMRAQLKVLCMDRRPETAALAIQTSMMLGDWMGFAQNLLSNDQMRSHWEKTLALAEQCVASEPDNLASLTTELKEVYADASGSLLELFVGPASAEGAAAAEQAAEPLMRRLVDVLGSERMEERVLAAYQLKRLTGKDLGFQPSVPNRAAVQLWRRELAKNANSMLLPMDNPLWEAQKSLPSDVR